MPRPRIAPWLALAALPLLLTAVSVTPVTAAADPAASTGPSVPGTDAAPGLTAIDWRLRQVAGSGIPVIEVPPNVEATLRVDGARAGGSGGCNQWSSDVTIDGAAIAFGPIGSTLIACGDPAMSFETAYLGFLPQVRSWTSDGARLQLLDASGAVLLTFEGAGGTPIVGPEWHAIRLVAADGETAVPAGVDITLQLDRRGDASGQAACNHYIGGYTLDGARLSFSPMAITEMACPEPRMTLEAAWTQVLAQTAGWRLDGGHLVLVDVDGAPLATLASAAAASIAGRWSLVELGDPATGTVSRLTTDAVLEVGADGAITGTTGCSGLVAQADLGDGTITVGPVGTQGMPCAGPAETAVETALLGALAGASRWTIDSLGWLELLDADGRLLVAFERSGVALAGPWAA